MATVRSADRRRPTKASREGRARKQRRVRRPAATSERPRGLRRSSQACAEAVFRGRLCRAGRRLVRRRTVPSPSAISTISSVRALRMVRPSPAALSGSRAFQPRHQLALLRIEHVDDELCPAADRTPCGGSGPRQAARLRLPRPARPRRHRQEAVAGLGDDDLEVGDHVFIQAVAQAERSGHQAAERHVLGRGSGMDQRYRRRSSFPTIHHVQVLATGPAEPAPHQQVVRHLLVPLDDLAPASGTDGVAARMSGDVPHVDETVVPRACRAGPPSRGS